LTIEILLEAMGSFLLSTFLPVIITYFCVGTFAVVCMMAGKSVLMYSGSEPPASVPQLTNVTELNGTDTITLPASNNSEAHTPLQVATAVCFVVGLWQVSRSCKRRHLSKIFSG
jgi:hypothetical protein